MCACVCVCACCAWSGCRNTTHNCVNACTPCATPAAYTIIGSDEELPLGEEFQSLVRCFIDTHDKKVDKRYGPAAKLLDQLA